MKRKKKYLLYVYNSVFSGSTEKDTVNGLLGLNYYYYYYRL